MAGRYATRLESSIEIAGSSHNTMVAAVPVSCPNPKVLLNGDLCPLVMTSGTPHACRMTISRKAVAVVAMAAAVSAVWLRPRLMRWGQPMRRSLGPVPAPSSFPRAIGAATMAVTIEVPPDQVWLWLVQMGGDRGVGIRGTESTTGVAQVQKKST